MKRDRCFDHFGGDQRISYRAVLGREMTILRLEAVAGLRDTESEQLGDIIGHVFAYHDEEIREIQCFERAVKVAEISSRQHRRRPAEIALELVQHQSLNRNESQSDLLRQFPP